MGRLKKIAAGLATLIMFNAISIGCFAMEKGNTEKNNKKEGSSNFVLNFFDVKQNENVLLGKKMKQENNFFNRNENFDCFRFKEEDSKDDNIKIENKSIKPYFENINSINLIEDDGGNKENEKSKEKLMSYSEFMARNMFNNKIENKSIKPYFENINCFRFKEEDSKDDNIKIEVKPSMPLENVEVYRNLNYNNFENSLNKDSLDGEKIKEAIYKLLKEPFNFNFLEYFNVFDLGILGKLKFIVDEYKKDILDYFLRENIKFMYQKYIDRYLEEKGMEEKYSINMKDKYFCSHKNKWGLLKNWIYIIMPIDISMHEGFSVEEFFKELTIKAKVILGNAAVKTREDLKNISDEEFENVKNILLEKSRHFEDDENFNGCWNYIKEGLKQLKKEDLCYSYLDSVDNFMQKLGYMFKYRGKDGNIDNKVVKILYITNENGLKICNEDSRIEKDIQFEEFNMEKAFSLDSQKSLENIKKEDIDRYMFLEERDERGKQANLVKDEFKKLIFVDRLYDNIETNVNSFFNLINKEKNNEKDSKKSTKKKLIKIICTPINLKGYRNELRKTKFTMVFKPNVDQNNILGYCKNIATKIKQIIGEAIVKTKQEFDFGNVSDFNMLKKRILERKELHEYISKKMDEEEFKTVLKELKEITCKDVLSVFDHFKKFENFIDTINFKYKDLDELNNNCIRQYPIDFCVYGRDLKNVCFKDNGLTIKFEDYDLEEELKKAEQNKKLFIDNSKEKNKNSKEKNKKMFIIKK